MQIRMQGMMIPGFTIQAEICYDETGSCGRTLQKAGGRGG